MKHSNGRLVPLLLLITLAFCAQATAQEPTVPPQYHSRSELLVERRKVENAFPDLVRALRTLHLAPDKMREVEEKLRRAEVETRAAREELQSLSKKEEGQEYQGRPENSARVTAR